MALPSVRLSLRLCLSLHPFLRVSLQVYQHRFQILILRGHRRLARALHQAPRFPDDASSGVQRPFRELPLPRRTTTSVPVEKRPVTVQGTRISPTGKKAQLDLGSEQAKGCKFEAEKSVKQSKNTSKSSKSKDDDELQDRPLPDGSSSARDVARVTSTSEFPGETSLMKTLPAKSRGLTSSPRLRRIRKQHTAKLENYSSRTP